MLQKPDACIFDLDGTLVQHKNQQLIATLERYDTLVHILTHPFKGSERMPEEMDLTVNVESNPFMHRLVHQLRQWREIGVDQIVEPANDIFAFLNILRAHHVRIAVTSNAYGKSYGRHVLEEYGLDQYIDAAVFRENCKRGKPNPESILRTIKMMELGTGAKTIWYIGDQAKDMKAALEAREKLPEGYTLIPLAFRATLSTAYYYLSRVHRDHKDISNQNYVRSFAHLIQKAEKLFV